MSARRTPAAGAQSGQPLATGGDVWIGITDLDGVVRLGTDGWLEGVSSGQRPVFVNGSRGMWFGSFHPPKALVEPLRRANLPVPDDLADLGVPVVGVNGQNLDILLPADERDHHRVSMHRFADSRVTTRPMAAGKVRGVHANDQVLEPLHKRRSTARTVVLTMSAQPRHVAEALRVGASGCVLKGSPASEVLKTLESYRSRIVAKLDVHDVPALVRLAIREGLISADDR